MSLTVIRLVPAFLLALALCAWVRPAAAGPNDRPRRAEAAATSERLGLFSPRVRRSTVTYLRLRLLELREQQLERARAAIERRLSIDELIFGSAATPPEHRTLP